MIQKVSSKQALRFALWLLLAVLALAQGTWSLGPYTLTSGRPSPPLQYSLAAQGGLGSYDFVSRVGGVAFSQIAKPVDENTGSPRITLHYDRQSKDGQRLRLTVAGVDAIGDIPDWMLIPIARFADSKYDACVSLFGPATTKTVYDIVYHESFQNTLLGLRLLQADMLMFNLGETWRLPQLNGVTVLGLGETAPGQMDVASARAIQAGLAQSKFQSWVLTDQKEEVRFTVEDGSLRLSGEPYYYFWRSDVSAYQAERAVLMARADGLRQEGKVAEHNQIVRKVNALRPRVEEVTDLTERIKASRSAFRRFNAPVFNAASQTMRYSAFFRYARASGGMDWKKFLAELAPASVSPVVVTPTRWAR